MIKMIALDLDNTLLNSRKEISARNEAVLKKLHEQGIRVVLCTGRPINAIWPYIEQLGLTAAEDYTITFATERGGEYKPGEAGSPAAAGLRGNKRNPAECFGFRPGI